MMGNLLDVNVLIGLMWPTHESHKRARSWFHQNSREGWATCPLTQAAFVRIVSSPASFPNAVPPQEAVDLLEANLQDPRHRFWADDVSFVEAVQPFLGRLKGHKQVTDAYLLGLALYKKGKLISLDRGILDLLPEQSVERRSVVIL
jgi:toxin-antitoxin system PIN domain toxin